MYLQKRSAAAEELVWQKALKWNIYVTSLFRFGGFLKREKMFGGILPKNNKKRGI
jgi:hypothetical protein